MQDEQATPVQQQRHHRPQQREGKQRVVDAGRRLDVDAAEIADQEGADGMPCQILPVRFEAEDRRGLGRRLRHVDRADGDQDIRRPRLRRLQLGQRHVGCDGQAIGPVVTSLPHRPAMGKRITKVWGERLVARHHAGLPLFWTCRSQSDSEAERQTYWTSSGAA